MRGAETTKEQAVWQRLRAEMPVVGRLAYFDHAAVAPISRPATEAIQRWLEQASHEGGLVWSQWAKRVESVRETAAQLVAARTSEVAIVPNTTAGVNLVSQGFGWNAGDNVVTLANEFPSNLYPWMQLADRGVTTRAVDAGLPLDLSKVLAACDARTRIIAVSWVSYCTGWRLDLASLLEEAHRRGILVFLDAIQGLGVFPLDVRALPVDFFAADGHKWLLGPEGAGLFFVREEHLDRLRPVSVGWNSVVQGHNFSHIELRLRATAARFEGGSQNMVGVTGLGGSLELLRRYGLGPERSPLADRVIWVSDLAVERLQQIGARISSCRDDTAKSGIVSFELPGPPPEKIRAHCRESGVLFSCRDGKLRISPHAYNDQEDVERLIDALRAAMKEAG